MLLLFLYLANTTPAVSCQMSCVMISSMPPHPGSSIISPLQRPYDGPFAFLRRNPRSFTIRVGTQDEIIAVSRFKPDMDSYAKPGSPWPTARHGGLPAPRRAYFQTPWYLHFLAL
jgi:hypothetical protein